MGFNSKNFFRTNDIYGTPRDFQVPKPIYHLFVTIPSGWPIVVPFHMQQYKQMIEMTHIYDHLEEGTAEQCIQRQLEILSKMSITPQQP